MLWSAMVVTKTAQMEIWQRCFRVERSRQPLIVLYALEDVAIRMRGTSLNGI